jgi:hypothetical protein
MLIMALTDKSCVGCSHKTTGTLAFSPWPMKVRVQSTNDVCPRLVYEGIEKKGQDFSSLSSLLDYLYNNQPWALFPIQVA